MARKIKIIVPKAQRYDSADYLKTAEDVTAYLNAALEEGRDDPAFMARALGVVARANGGIKKLAEKTGISREGLHKALSDDGNPSLGTTLKVLKGLGVKLNVADAQH
jgi:probable addiction module antidote protein